MNKIFDVNFASFREIIVFEGDANLEHLQLELRCVIDAAYSNIPTLTR